MLYVVGSGPSGISCAHALLSKGEQVTLLDAGIELEEDRKNILKKVGKPVNLSLFNKIKGNINPVAKDVLKLVYGSDYPYKEVKQHVPIKTVDTTCRPSFAKGGLSTVWGSSIMPCIDEDISDWPISIKDLKQYYNKVFSFMPLACNKDELADKFPLYADKTYDFHQSRQADLLMQRFKKHKSKLNKKGILFGSSRLAVNFSKCDYGGLCMYGCPYKLIYSSEFTLEELKKNKNFTYLPGIVVEKIIENNDNVQIICHELQSKHPKKFTCERIFLACGSILSTKIILSSLDKYDYPVTLKDSQHIHVPCIMINGASEVTKEKLHSLTQLYLEIFDKKISPYSIHAQIYTYNDLYKTFFKKKLGKLYNILQKPLELLMGRIIYIKFYLHSYSSSEMKLQLKKGNPDTVTISSAINKSTKQTIKKMTFKFLKNFRLLGFIPMTPMLKISKPGGANHYGCSFPMSANPKNNESDILGRPYGLKRTHIVDSSVLPSIPAQSITLTVMANAYRIGDTYKK
ncbi:hypothetical protein COV18_02040 [Candidatus Woesearchaeota archaeon CG10_big_fil_rev_8_21_14_0_10_37_12]|nr:MAG: hypothetical protein COV18_02040 [Candidatus Woesearchaeota archaeon CG10_big_fil_rev_8_21_14_0_10_37_12]